MAEMVPTSPARTRMPREYEERMRSPMTPQRRDHSETAASPPSNATTGSGPDRFIPDRALSGIGGHGSLLQYSPSRPARTPVHSVNRAVGASDPYRALLQSQILGIASPASPSEGGDENTTQIGQRAHSTERRTAALPASDVLRYSSPSRGGGDGSGAPAGGAFSGRQAMSHLSPMAAQGTGAGMLSPGRAGRRISKSAFKVLDAPNLQDDYYLNLLAWSSRNVLAVALGGSVYLWNAATADVDTLCNLTAEGLVTSVSWSGGGKYVAVGLSSGSVQLWDTEATKLVRRLRVHHSRVACSAWSDTLLATGSRDRSIHMQDVRERAEGRSLEFHRQEVCGLRWSPDGQMLASGGNDNRLLIWDRRRESPLRRIRAHEAAVKAIAWSPHQSGLVASGGGTADRHIKFWNVNSGHLLNSVDTGSQVCNLAWSRSVNEIVSTHGFSLNQVVVWKYPTMSKLATLTGHSYRVLYLAMSPDGQTVVTGAGDETLRFWNLFPSMSGGRSTSLSPATQLPGSPGIR